jgi:hypothetical protein
MRRSAACVILRPEVALPGTFDYGAKLSVMVKVSRFRAGNPA